MNDEQSTILGILSQHSEPALAVEQIKHEHGIEQIGLNSLKFMLAIIEIEHQLGRSVFNVDIMPRLKTVGDVLALVA